MLIIDLLLSYQVIGYWIYFTIMAFVVKRCVGIKCSFLVVIKIR